MPDAVVAERVVKRYRAGEVEVTALRGVTFTLPERRFAALIGPSGSGKTTLLNMIGALDRPSEGRLVVLGEEVGHLSRRQAARFRAERIGFVFQDFNLIPVLTAAENVEYPLVMVQSWPAEKRRKRVAELLAAVDMTSEANKRPDQLSGGQKQRVAIARALATGAKLVLADEPTANLDGETAQRVIALMRRIRDEEGVTFLFSTHDPRIIGAVDTILRIEDGAVRMEAPKEAAHA
ncbi:ABC transporter ATP-binding protein [Elioraea thermophila]|uniref:ABC transporter ATP-binding protein n=1 Tax=Elioraea thermophila TaxID=2185104 RepID=UPI000DF45ED0|nr:ABC transporter ATP-binding protein [Elioraea thermophila]